MYIIVQIRILNFKPHLYIFLIHFHKSRTVSIFYSLLFYYHCKCYFNKYSIVILLNLIKLSHTHADTYYFTLYTFKAI